MSTIQPQFDRSVVSAAPVSVPGSTTPTLKPVLSTRYAITKGQASFVIPFVLLFLYVSHLPIHTSAWRRVLTGERIISSQAIPSAPVSVPLAQGGEFIHVSWLTDVVMAGLNRIGGPFALMAFSSLAVLFMAGLWSRTFWSLSHQKRWVLAGLFLTAAAWWRYLPMPGTLYTEGICFAIFGWLVFRKTNRGQTWHHSFRVCLLMAVWANMGISFLAGLVVLSYFAIEETVITVCNLRANNKTFWRVFSNHNVQNAWWMLQAGLLACCLTPNHFKIWPAMFRSQWNPFWLEAGQFAPLLLASLPGVIFAATILFVLWATSRHGKLSIAEVLTIATGGTAVAINEHLLTWFVPLAVVSAIRLLGSAKVDGYSRHSEPAIEKEHKPLMFAWSLICLLLVWCGFAMSPLSDPLLARTPKTPTQFLSSATPDGATRYLDEHPPRGLVWASADWSDWIAFAGNGKTQVFTNSQFAVLPRHAKRDYGKIYKADHDWLSSADRYAVQTLVVDKANQHTLEIELRKTSDWILQYEDSQAMVLTRRELK